MYTHVQRGGQLDVLTGVQLQSLEVGEWGRHGAGTVDICHSISLQKRGRKQEEEELSLIDEIDEK